MPPTQEEIDGDLYIPPTDPADEGLDPVDACVDTPADAEPTVAPTFTNVRETLFSSSCVFSSCHGVGGAAAGLDLMATDVHDVLLSRIGQRGIGYENSRCSRFARGCLDQYTAS